MNFLDLINETYNFILGSNDSICKIDSIKRCKYFLDLSEEDTIGDYYYQNLGANNKGVVYTPIELADYMIKNTISQDIINNPFLKILDPSCGCGHLILRLFHHLKGLYVSNLKEINNVHNLQLTEENINEHIIKYNLFCIDIDEYALKILSIELFYQSGYLESRNIKCMDFLTELLDIKFDVVIGNPPYVGTKSLNKEYSIQLRNLYPEVFADKGDISYCFFQRALQCLQDSYKITLITSRYFMESLSGEKLREFITIHSNIYRIVDFYGNRPFKNAGIDPVILFLSSDYIQDLEVKKPSGNLKTKNFMSDNNFNTISVPWKSITKDPWRLQQKSVLDIINKVEGKCENKLQELCCSYQGIITGLDKAFILEQEDIVRYGIEKAIIKPWIKSSNITKNGIIKNNLYIIYSDLIKNEKDFPNAVNYIRSYRERLVERRECKSGKRAWYGLQWGREQSLFEKEKIIFPYKSADNRFEIDKGDYFSADVYSLVIKEDADMDYHYLKMILNSNLYEFYFKCFAKKLGGKLYEYYPNNLQRLAIPSQRESKIIAEEDLYSYFNLSGEEIEYVESIKG